LEGLKHIGGALRGVRVPALAVITAFLLGAVVIVLTDYEHLQHLGTDPVGAIGGAVRGVADGYTAMLTGAIGDPGRMLAALQSGDARDIATAIRPISEALVTATPFIFVTLGLAVSFHAGLFNLGADGQFFMGGVGASITAALVAAHLPPFLVLVVALLGGTLAGSAYGFIPGFLKARTGAHEVITTLMLNAVAPNVPFLIFGWIDFSGPPPPIPSIPPIIDLPTVRVDYGFVVAVAMAAVVSFLLFRTTLGFELRATGFSRTVVRGAGIQPGRTTMLAMSLSGGLVGMGSAFFALGPGGGFSGPPSMDMGYVAIALALIAGLRPGGVVLMALLYAALTNGAKQMVIVTGIPLALLLVIISLAMMFVAAPGLIRSIWRIKALDPALASPSTRPAGPADST
jgi:general nucleoside transport system permease protein